MPPLASDLPNAPPVRPTSWPGRFIAPVAPSSEPPSRIPAQPIIPDHSSGKALQTLQQHAEDLEAMVAALLSDMGNGRRPELMQQFTDIFHDEIEGTDVYAEASSTTHFFESDWATLKLKDFGFGGFVSGYDFAVVQGGRSRVVVQINIPVLAEAECQYSLAVWDSVDKEYVPLGGSEAKTVVEFDALVLVTFDGDFSATTPRVDSLGVELIESIESVDFGQSEFDYGDDRY